MSTKNNFFFLLLFLPIVHGDKIVKTNIGPIRGISITEKKVAAFLGIPYAEPPIGSLRFSRPLSKTAWKDILEANKLPNACVQAIMGFLPTDPKKMSEDCLYLNLWMPENENQLKPVMVYIHGGAFMAGSSNMKIYNGANLAERGGVIVATINYRVGSLGFFSGRRFLLFKSLFILNKLHLLKFVYLHLLINLIFFIVIFCFIYLFISLWCIIKL